MNNTKKNAVLYAAMISLGGFVFGFDASVISGTLGFVISDFTNFWPASTLYPL